MQDLNSSVAPESRHSSFNICRNVTSLDLKISNLDASFFPDNMFQENVNLKANSSCHGMHSAILYYKCKLTNHGK